MAACMSKLADPAVFIIVLYFNSVCVCVMSVAVCTIFTDFFIPHMYVKQTNLFLFVVICVFFPLEISHWGLSF